MSWWYHFRSSLDGVRMKIGIMVIVVIAELSMSQFLVQTVGKHIMNVLIAIMAVIIKKGEFYGQIDN